MTERELKLLEATRNMMKRLYGKDCKCEVKDTYTNEGGMLLMFYANGKIAVDQRFGGIDSDFDTIREMFSGIGDTKMDLDAMLPPYLDNPKEDLYLDDMFTDGEFIPDSTGKVAGFKGLAWSKDGDPWEVRVYNARWAYYDDTK